eukprot:bmy_04242T0
MVLTTNYDNLLELFGQQHDKPMESLDLKDKSKVRPGAGAGGASAGRGAGVFALLPCCGTSCHLPAEGPSQERCCLLAEAPLPAGTRRGGPGTGRCRQPLRTPRLPALASGLLLSCTPARALSSYEMWVDHSFIASVVFPVRHVCLWICTIAAGYGCCLFLLHCWRAGGPSRAPHAGTPRPVAMLSYSGPGEVWELPLGGLSPGAWLRNCDGAPADAASRPPP